MPHFEDYYYYLKNIRWILNSSLADTTIGSSSISKVQKDIDSLKICPTCNKDNSVSLIPLQRDEAYRYTFEDKRGLDIQFLKIKTPHNNL
jgi:hypothetical protein